MNIAGCVDGLLDEALKRRRTSRCLSSFIDAFRSTTSGVSAQSKRETSLRNCMNPDNREFGLDRADEWRKQFATSSSTTSTRRAFDIICLASQCCTKRTVGPYEVFLACSARIAPAWRGRYSMSSLVCTY